jgi:hypothetical protein
MQYFAVGVWRNNADAGGAVLKNETIKLGRPSGKFRCYVTGAIGIIASNWQPGILNYPTLKRGFAINFTIGASEAPLFRPTAWAIKNFDAGIAARSCGEVVLIYLLLNSRVKNFAISWIFNSVSIIWNRKREDWGITVTHRSQTPKVVVSGYRHGDLAAIRWNFYNQWHCQFQNQMHSPHIGNHRMVFNPVSVSSYA